MRTELIIPEHVPSLNGKGGMLRSHWSKKTAIIKKYRWFFRSLTTNQHKGQVRMTITRMSLNPTMDYDNLVGCYKHHVDAIKAAGIITDDGPKVIVESRYEQVRALDKTQQRTLILIEDV
ncbi:hypothetical protein DYU11_22700 [Fibrisoma montanum]|uniref:Uncharacterized protein n=1 Tax=Fibrisoma montanum TaxID=2305895 RepID=A0A418M1X5_9BACT|nr:hypothetical protein [Fibrisoma montanum]RIV19742.1 hypothetical protein DYU11_22700 [Fibrisoma montanum]